MGRHVSSDWKIKLIEICKILKDNGIDISEIPTRKTVSDGKRVTTTLKDINVAEIDKIIKENDLNEDFPIGKYIKEYRNAYNGTRGALTTEEREAGQVLGIVVKYKEEVSAPIFKGGKLSQFHLDYISKILDKILNGEINTREALELLKQASISSGETIIEDVGSIKKCVEILLKDKPEEYEAYLEMVKRNSGRRNPYKGKIRKTENWFLS